METVTEIFEGKTYTRAVVNRTTIEGWCVELGLAPDSIREIRVAYGQVIAVVYHTAEEQSRVIEPEGRGVLTFEMSFPIVD